MSYEEELQLHNAKWEKLKPKKEDFNTEKEYLSALNQWGFDEHMYRPNKPNYKFANND